MKTVIVTFLYDVMLGGGGGLVSRLLSTELIKTGCEVTVITSSSKMSSTVIVGGVKVISIYPANLFWIYNKDRQPTWKKMIWQLIDTWNPWVYQALKPVFMKECPDILHVHKLRGFSPSVWNAGRDAGIPVIVHTSHDFEIVSPQGLLGGRVGKLAEEQALVMRPYQAIRRRASRLVKGFTTPSHILMDTHNRLGFFPNARKRVIHNSHGFHLEELAGLRRDFLENKVGGGPVRRFLYLGRLDKAKGIDLLCKAFLDVARHYSNAKLDIAGWGPLENELKRRYDQTPQVFFYGNVQGATKHRLLSECDMVVVPSIAPESFGIVVVEAFAYGKPVIAARVGALPEIVTEGKTGFLFAPGDIDALTVALLHACENVHTSDLREACFNEAPNYLVERMAEEYVSIYNES